MDKIKVNDLMRSTGIAFADIQKKMQEAGVTVDSEDQLIDVSTFKSVQTSKPVKRLSLKKRPVSKTRTVAVTGQSDTSLVSPTTKEDLKSLKKQRKTPDEPVKTEPKKATEPTPIPAISKPISKNADGMPEIELPSSLRVSELCTRLDKKQSDVLKVLYDLGIMAGVSHVVDFDTMYLVAAEMGLQAIESKSTPLKKESQKVEDTLSGEQKARPPVVTIMGHVDHGKTSLLDAIRSSKVALKEAGGITQHIGAYQISSQKGEITFLDTPGHEAFTAMRARGALCTDIVVLVVSADDGFMPQTKEALEHARAAKVPVIVAITKVDKPGADAEGIIHSLAQYDLLPEAWGGDTQVQKVSSKTGEGIDELLDAILLQAEMLELQARGTGPATGVVIEAKLDKGRGPVATLLVQHGVLATGDALLVGAYYGKVRRMNDDMGNTIKNAKAATPVEVIGLSGLPHAGDNFGVKTSEKLAKQESNELQMQLRAEKIQHSPLSIDELLKKMSGQEKKSLSIVLKTDVTGSLEALEAALVALSNDEIDVSLVARGVGGINESDAQLARASQAIIVGFNVRADNAAKKVIEQYQLNLSYFSVIYDLIKHIKQILRGIAGPKFSEKIIGLAQVREVFRSSRYGAIAGCMVTEGVVKRNALVRVLRDNVVIFQGKLESLRRMKNDAEEVRTGTECGIGIRDYNDIKARDQIEAYIEEQIDHHDDD